VEDMEAKKRQRRVDRSEFEGLSRDNLVDKCVVLANGLHILATEANQTLRRMERYRAAATQWRQRYRKVVRAV